MTHHRHRFWWMVGLIALVGVGFSGGAAVAQRNCKPWLIAAQQESARGNTQMAAEAMRIYRECVKQAYSAAGRAGDSFGRNLNWVDPQYYGVVMDSVANPTGPRVVKLPGYKPNLVPGRPPGPIGGRPPGVPGQSGGSSACPGGCPPGTGTAAQQKSFHRSAYGQRNAMGFAGRDAYAARAGGRTMAGPRSGLARSAYGARTLSARHPTYAGRSSYSARSAYGAGGRGLTYRPPAMRRGLR